MIPVTKAYLPEKEKYQSYVSDIFDRAWLTNNGCLLQELEQRLTQHLGVRNLILVANGSLALQLAYKALGLTGEIITTPFSFAATTSTLVWEGLTPVFADIDPHTFNLDPANIAAQITSNTTAIVPVHVFGNPCAVEAIQKVADQHQLKVIYDAAHAFDTQYKGQSVLNYGDISTLSFHATKLFHTIEGGAVITNDDQLAAKIRLLINFGISGPSKIESLGTNAKMSEFQAAMGLCVLDEIDNIKQQRAKVWHKYVEDLTKVVSFQQWSQHSDNNYAYAPVLFESEQQLLEAEAYLKQNNILPRRYFHPSLDTLTYLKAKQICKHSRDIASRILCLPIYPTLNEREQNIILNVLKGLYQGNSDQMLSFSVC
ncbi:MAG: DegT/DnrJ/EryC1/StrS family aminotransferase [Aeromonadales bacterium]|nr:DegT/DnrJ/EryC1/StrS family aminotransferase [Aeromonadales bacterium]